MVSRTIKISDENYRKLIMIASDLQKIKEEKVSFDDALEEIIGGMDKKNDIMDFAGAWSDMTGEEAEEFMDTIYKERKIKSRRLLE